MQTTLWLFPLKVLGYVPKSPELALESRHLGLVMPEEIEGLQEKLEKLAGLLEETLDIDGILKCAGKAKKYHAFDSRRKLPVMQRRKKYQFRSHLLQQFQVFLITETKCLVPCNSDSDFGNPCPDWLF